MRDAADADPHDDESADERIFLLAIEIDDASRRDEFVRHACGTDADLRRAVEAMIADHDRTGRLFREIVAGVGESDPFAAATDAPDAIDCGDVVGPYTIVRSLGEGGGGTVYEADQATPVRRKVAVKVLKAALDTGRVMTRFAAERQALERMEHPNIARLLDAGVTRAGQPYFVMELVQGLRITDHCKRHGSSLRETLRLLEQTCVAVQHAHQKGVIHRDLKPSNILVSMIDGVATPKVIDFGIAKATVAAGDEWAAPGGPVGTPLYMSPEQIRGSADIDTRSDIYSLGVVLHELLAGRPLLSDAEALTGSVEEIRDRLLHLRPPPLAGGRGPFDPRTDLDWVVQKATAIDREDRYQTVRGLGEEINRVLADKPIAARPAGHAYRLAKSVQRNRLASAACVIAVLGLLGGLTTSTALYVKARDAERQQARLRAEAEEREHVTKAAILILQSRPADADAEVKRMGGSLTQPSLEATTVFRTLAIWNAMRGDWRAASERLLALSRVNRFDDADQTDNATRDLIAVPPVLLTAGEVSEYEAFRRMVVGRLGHTNNAVAAEHVLKISLLIPPPAEELAALRSVAQVAERSLRSTTTTRPAAANVGLADWRRFALGLWNYRTGHDAEAVKWLDSVLRPANQSSAMYACGLSVRSMARQRLGLAEAAIADATQADALVAARFARALDFDSQGYWHDWLNARILCAEAAGVVRSPPPTSSHESVR